MKKEFKEKFLETLKVPDNKTKLKNNLGIIKTPKVPFYKKMFSSRRHTVMIFSGVLAFSLLIVFGSIMFSNYKNTPVYKGMFINQSTSLMSSNGFNYYNETRDLDEIEDLVEKEIDVSFIESVSYYSTKRETILVTVQIENPNFYEILSFTLNGKLYQTFEFQDGSNSEQIIVKFETAGISGIQEITIDAIKYVDDTTIKSARFNGTRTIKIAILYEDAPKVNEVAEIVETTTFGVSFIARDKDNLIDIEDNGLMLFLFDGDKIIEKSKLTLGRNVLPYSNLKMGHSYEYAIVGVYDLLDGEGKKAYVLHYNKVNTKEAFEFDIKDVSYEAVSFKLNTVDSVNGVVTKVELIKDGATVDSGFDDLNLVTFDQLASSSDYEIVVTYRYAIIVNELDAVIEKTITTAFKTLERPLPRVTITSLVPGKETVTFDIDIFDTSTLGYISNVSLYKDDLLIQNEDEKILAFDKLLSNSDYRLEITYQYDLVDGNGFNEMTESVEFKTLSKEVPVITYKDIVRTQTSIDFNYDVVDNDNIILIGSIELVHIGLVVKTILPTDMLTLTELLSDNTYTIKINYSYDLNDGNGTLSDSALVDVKTMSKQKPVFKISNAVNFGTKLFVTFSMLDVDDISNLLAVEIYKDGLLVDSITNTFNLISDPNIQGKQTGDVAFSDLNSGTYQVVLVYEYNLNEGSGVIQVNYDDILFENNSIFVNVG